MLSTNIITHHPSSCQINNKIIQIKHHQLSLRYPGRSISTVVKDKEIRPLMYSKTNWMQVSF